jgi:ubiquinone/menaquinone biosynthesis C-methylase UbiE
MAANFNNSAWFYDRLSRLVYGRAIINAQVYLLKQVPENSHVLIVGGGTGWILEELARVHPSGLKITYVEIAPNMMALSRKRNTGSNKVIFINDAIEHVGIGSNFDVVITPFLLDNFTEQNLAKIFTSIDTLLKKDGLWFNASFHQGGKWWQWVLLNAMFVFFKVICGIEASKLPGIDKQFDLNGYVQTNEKLFYGDFIAGKVYRK